MEVKDDWITYTTCLVKYYWNQYASKNFRRYVDKDLTDDVVQDVLTDVLEDECVMGWIADWPLEDELLSVYKRIVYTKASKFLFREVRNHYTKHQFVVDDEVWTAISNRTKGFDDFEEIDYKIDQVVQDKGKMLSDRWVDTRYNDQRYIRWIAMWDAWDRLNKSQQELLLHILDEKRMIGGKEMSEEYYPLKKRGTTAKNLERAIKKFKKLAAEAYERYTNESEQS